MGILVAGEGAVKGSGEAGTTFGSSGDNMCVNGGLERQDWGT